MNSSQSYMQENNMNFPPYPPYAVSQVTYGPSPSDVRLWTRFLRAKLRKIIEHMGRPYMDGYPPA
jgi:hypothetical protein